MRPLRSAATGCGPRVAAAGRRLGARDTQVHDEHTNRNSTRDMQRALGFADRRGALVLFRRRHGQYAAPTPAGEALVDRRVHALQLQARFGQPLLQVGDCRRIVIIEMRPRGEHLHPLEPMGCNLEEMIARQPLTVVEVRRYPEASLEHGPNHPL